MKRPKGFARRLRVFLREAQKDRRLNRWECKAAVAATKGPDEPTCGRFLDRIWGKIERGAARDGKRLPVGDGTVRDWESFWQWLWENREEIIAFIIKIMALFALEPESADDESETPA